MPFARYHCIIRIFAHVMFMIYYYYLYLVLNKKKVYVIIVMSSHWFRGAGEGSRIIRKCHTYQIFQNNIPSYRIIVDSSETCLNWFNIYYT